MPQITMPSTLSTLNGNLRKSGDIIAKTGLKKSLLAFAVIASATGCITGADAKAQTNREVVLRYFQLVDSKKTETISEAEAPGLTYRLPVGVMDAPGHTQLVKGFATAFPNYKHTIARCVEAGDLVSCEGKFTGDHTGPLAMADGSVLPATQRHVEFPIAVFARVQNGKLVEFNGYFDLLGFLGQLGVGPAAAK